jgi:hypothetical protein
MTKPGVIGELNDGFDVGTLSTYRMDNVREFEGDRSLGWRWRLVTGAGEERERGGEQIGAEFHFYPTSIGAFMMTQPLELSEPTCALV